MFGRAASLAESEDLYQQDWALIIHPVVDCGQLASLWWIAEMLPGGNTPDPGLLN